MKRLCSVFAALAFCAVSVAQQQSGILVAAPNGILTYEASTRILPFTESPRIMLVRSGSEPRSLLRYQLRSDISGIDVEELGTAVTAMGKGMPEAHSFVEQFQWTWVTAPGPDAASVKVSARVVKADVQLGNDIDKKSERRAQKELSKLLRGIEASYVLNTRGCSSSFSSVIPQGVPEEVAASFHPSRFNTSTAPVLPIVMLPEDPVGVGAEWEVVERTYDDLLGRETPVLVVTRYRLSHHSTKNITLETRTTEYLLLDSSKPIAMAPGQATYVRGFHMTRSGTINLNLLDITYGDALLQGNAHVEMLCTGGECAVEGETATIQGQTRMQIRRTSEPKSKGR